MAGTSTTESPGVPRRAGEASGGGKQELFKVKDRGEQEQPWEIEQEVSCVPHCLSIGLFITVQHATEGVSFIVEGKQE